METHEQAQALVAAVEEALPRWVEGCVERLVVAHRGTLDPEVATEARQAGRRAAAEVGARIRQLVGADIDEQRANPLSLLRDAVRYPTQVLERAGVPPVARDSFSVERFPDDVYDLTPASFADVDPALHEPGMSWGAAKAMAHMRRHRPQAEGATRIAAFVPDLMDRSKVAAAAAAAPGGTVGVTFVRSADELANVGAEIVVVDLARPGVLAALPGLSGARTIGFASHVDAELVEAAKAAGCSEVLARSRFFSRLPELLS